MLARLSTAPPFPSPSLLLVSVQYLPFLVSFFGVPLSHSHSHMSLSQPHCHSQLGGHMSNQGPPNQSQKFYYRSLGATVVPTENGPCFFPVIF